MRSVLQGLRWLDGASDAKAACVICNDEGAKRLVLRISSPRPRRPPLTLVECTACSGRYFLDFRVPRYATEGPKELVQYNVEQGAGIDIMLGHLFCLPPAARQRHLEIGCGFGFAVDFAQRTLGWESRGFDPSLLARVGRRLLGVPVELENWDGGTDAPRSYERIHASEVIEHLTDPQTFARAAARALAENGALTVSTPNASRLLPDATPLTQYMILSPGFHAVLFTDKALRLLLERAGFDQVHVWERDTTLFALASHVPLQAARPPEVERTAYRRYLAGRLRELPLGSMLGCGFAYRLFKDCVNAGEWEEARQQLVRLRAEVLARFDLDVETPEAIGRVRPRLASVARRWPFNLCGVLYFQGMLALNYEGSPQRATALFAAATHVGAVIRQALARVGMDDGETADLSERARAHARLAAARC